MFSGIPAQDAEVIATARAEILAAERLKELCKQLGLAVPTELQQPCGKERKHLNTLHHLHPLQLPFPAGRTTATRAAAARTTAWHLRGGCQARYKTTPTTGNNLFREDQVF